MMINKRLIGTVGQCKKYIAGNVLSQWVSLAANMIMMGTIAHLLQNLWQGSANAKQMGIAALIGGAAISVRVACAIVSSHMGYLSSKAVKQTLRTLIYEKLLRLGASYTDRVQTSEVVQVAVEGVDQLETYFGQYLPQFFYAMLAPLTLFGVLRFVSFPSAVASAGADPGILPQRSAGNDSGRVSCGADWSPGHLHCRCFLPGNSYFRVP